MRPLILGRDFVYENELKVFYVKNGDCKLEYKNEELIATVDIMNELALSLKGGVDIPPRAIAVLNVSSIYHHHIEHCFTFSCCKCALFIQS